VKGSDLIRVRLSLGYPALEAGVRALLSSDREITVIDSLPGGPPDEMTAADVHILTSAAALHQADWGSIREAPSGVIILGAN